MLKANDEAQHYAANDVRRTEGSMKTLARTFAQIVIVGAILFGGALGMQRIIATAPERPSRPQVAVVVPVTAERMERRDLRPTIRLFGEVISAQSLDLRPAGPGEIIDVHPGLAAGARVEAGDVLVRLDDFDARGAVVEARANLAQTEAAIVEIETRIAAEQDQGLASEEQLRLAREDLERAQALRQTGALTQKAVDDRALIVSQREAAANQRRSNLAIERARLEQQRAQRDRLLWKLEQAERALADLEITAPFAGIVLSANAEAGRRIGANDVVASIYSADALEVRFTLSDAQYGRLSNDVDPVIGRPITGAWDVGGTIVPFAGTVRRIGAEVASARGGVELFADIASSGATNAELRPGAFVSLELTDRLYTESFAVPETAVYTGGTIYIVGEDGTLTPRTVSVVAYDADNAVVTEGLSDGDVVLATRLTEIDSGTRVGVVAGSAKGYGAAFPQANRRPRGGEGSNGPSAGAEANRSQRGQGG